MKVAGFQPPPPLSAAFSDTGTMAQARLAQCSTSSPFQQGLEAGMVAEGVPDGVKLQNVDGEPGGGRKQIL